MGLSSIQSNELLEESDAHLLKAFASTDDEDAFCELVRRHAGMIRATAVRALGDESLADEVTQDTLVTLARKARSIRVTDGRSLGPWLHRVAVLECQNARRKEERMRRKIDTARRDLAAHGIQEEDAKVWLSAAPILDSAIDALPDKERKAIVLRFFENMRFRDIGFALGGKSPDAVRMLTNRALANLSKKLSQKGVTISAMAIAAGMSGMGATRFSTASSVLIGRKVLETVIASKASTSSFFAFAGTEWAIRGVAFCVGLGIPVAFSGFDSINRSKATALTADDRGKLELDVPQKKESRPRQLWSSESSEQDSLRRLLEQIAVLEDDYQDPAMLSEAMQRAIVLNQDQFPIAWEAVVEEAPPVALADAIVARWAELDPEVAFEAAAAIDDGLRQARIAMRVWYDYDEKAASRYFESLPHEFFDQATSWFWHAMALVDPGLGLRRNVDRARNDVASSIYHFTLLQGWFRTHDIPFIDSHIQGRPKGYYPLHEEVQDAIGELPRLTAQQFTGPLEFLAGFGDMELRGNYLEPLIAKLPTGTERQILVEWIRASSVLSEEFRATLLSREELETK